VLTLKAAGLVDIDAGSIVRPGILRIDGDRITAVGGPVSPRRAMLALARSHALDRVQFGRPLAGFQAVRHRLAETLVALEGASAARGNSPARPGLAWWRSGPRPGWRTYEA
jgi:hypothetical protein